MKKAAPLSVDSRLRDDVSFLGTQLGQTLQKYEGLRFFKLVEKVRLLSIRVRHGEKQIATRLHRLLEKESPHTQQQLAKAFTEFLRLTNLAEEVHRLRRRQEHREQGHGPQKGSPREVLLRLRQQGVSKAELHRELHRIHIELVLTAHPTETQLPGAIRRYQKMADLLLRKNRLGKDRLGQALLESELRREIESLWLSGSVREQSPSPQDEARQAMALAEEILWPALPAFLRELDEISREILGEPLEPQASPLSFASWVGGDRDGNPFVTAEVTRAVLRESGERALRLYRRDFHELREDLCFSESSELSPLERPTRLALTQIDEFLDPKTHPAAFWRRDPLLRLCAQLREALNAQGAQFLAEGRLRDIERRISAFGLNLLPLDIRQSSDRHEAAVAEILQLRGVTGYASMDEKTKRAQLQQVLGSAPLSEQQRRSLRAETQEILSTLDLYREFPREFFGLYVISMTEEISDLLEVEALLRWAGVDEAPPVCPLFETPEALERAAPLMQELMKEDFYRRNLPEFAPVMLGYSDSAKRSGRLHSAWRIYRLQQELTEIGTTAGLEIRFFHGRGGSVARGGGPIQTALLGLPRPHASPFIRVTEQGESIIAKLGLVGLAQRTFELYLSGFLEARLGQVDQVTKEWTTSMDEMAEDSAREFRSRIYENPRFMPHYLQVTPANELSLLKIGSRPSKRRADPSLESLRAIPWVFSWTQNRALLPAWLGLGSALDRQIKKGKQGLLRKMDRNWGFFHANLDLIEMTLAKADETVFAYYSSLLVEPDLQDLSLEYRRLFRRACRLTALVKNEPRLLTGNPVLARSIRLRTPYVDILNVLQVHFLKQARRHGLTPELERSLAITLGGISSGMRNTG